MRAPRNISHILAAVMLAVMAAALQGCFTGVESTPRITARDIKRQGIRQNPEDTYLADLKLESPRQWQPGKTFHVSDNRIALIFTPGVEGASATIPDSLGGTTLTLAAVDKIHGVTGADEVQLMFTDTAGHRLAYRPGLSVGAFGADSALNIPFAIDNALVDSVRNRLRGHTYYVLPQRRFDAAGNVTEGLRYIPVTVTDVQPGDANYPLRVLFTEKADTAVYSLLMTIGRSASATRNFKTLFSLTDPRLKYPQISDHAWDLIQHSRIETGMTPDECRLALGAPTEYIKFPTTAGMAERWTYGDGVYLYFEDGMLSRFRR